ncbi:MAG TPA: PIN domain-containing protein [Candidatus Acidoferrum sp.]|nr:PIN domain-containing protein [Candidatus Acidoferrum sp.]
MSWTAPGSVRPSPQMSPEDRYSTKNTALPPGTGATPQSHVFVGFGADFWALRVVLLAAATALGYGLPPFGWQRALAAVAGFCFAALLLAIEWRLLRGASGSVLAGAAGLVMGIFTALLTALLLSRTAILEPTKTFFAIAVLLAFAYLGLTLGAAYGPEFLTRRTDSLPAPPLAPSAESLKLLDTSVLIDGRIADICEAHFLDGVLVVPQFVLHELQMVADSGDALKRQRGRRGLEILQRMQKMPQLEVRLLEDGLPQDLDVDDKLVELARRMGAKLVTNDFNLNKVATVHGIAVLNVNLLANAMKPAVLPGEPMRVLILREGKEPNQGVAYLDDGTMVVVDGARRMINKSVAVVVTSVHQTTAGKMIFGRLDESGETSVSVAKQAAAGASAVRSEVAQNAPDASPNAGRTGTRPTDASRG